MKVYNNKTVFIKWKANEIKTKNENKLYLCLALYAQVPKPYV